MVLYSEQNKSNEICFLLRKLKISNIVLKKLYEIHKLWVFIFFFFFVKSRMKNEVLVNTICHAIVLLAASFRLQKIFRVCLASFVLCDENDFSEYYSPTTDYCNQSKVVLKRSLKREVKQNYK